MNLKEEVLGDTEATQPMPIIGETVVIMGIVYRCVMVQYMDKDEAGGPPQIRVIYKQVPR